jgi:hypothetical protein
LSRRRRDVQEQSRHPGLDPGPMNTALLDFPPAVFMGSGFRRNDGY